MFDIGWTEILVIVAVAVVVVGPKDIPKMLRTIGNYMRKAKTMMRDVRRQVEEVADISELKDLKAQADDLKNFDMEAATTPSSADLQATHDPVPMEAEPQTSSSALDAAAAQVKSAKVADETALEVSSKPTKKTAAKTTKKAKAKTTAKPKAAAKSKTKPKTKAVSKATKAGSKATTAKPKTKAKPIAQKTS